jgi:hypothetical protein
LLVFLRQRISADVALRVSITSYAKATMHTDQSNVFVDAATK